MGLQIHVLFCIVFAFAACMNHIDDTDETYGYYEPVHYLLYGYGMQTWEYSPAFAIRSYSFLAPFTALGHVLRLMGASKMQVFYGIRFFLGQILAYCLSDFIESISRKFGISYVWYITIILICSPGIFFCSTAFLPSAVGCTLVVAAISALLSDRHSSTIFFGCMAVLWTGWPFIGLVFLPLGLIILNKEFTNGGAMNVIRIAAIGIFHLVTVSSFVAYVDSMYYGKP